MFFVHIRRQRHELAALAGAIAIAWAAAAFPSPAIAGGQGGEQGAPPTVAVPGPGPGTKIRPPVSPYLVARQRQMAASTDGAHPGSKEAASPMMKLQNHRTHRPGQHGKAR